MGITNSGERLIPDEYKQSPQEYLIYLCHLETYRYAFEYVAGKFVLEVGCGTGYGTHMLSERCRSIIGVDISREAVEYAVKNYSNPNLEYKVIPSIEKSPLPFESNLFDVVVSFQVIEHINEAGTCLQEIHRVLKPGGTVIIATPDRSTRLFPFQKPWNAFHVHEYSDAELTELIHIFFKTVRMLKMGGDWKLFGIEQSRVRKMKWLSLPFTLPVIPETVRQKVLKYIMSVKRKRQNSKPGATAAWSFNADDIRIEESVPESVNLIA
ncbi:MAG: methyltransferase domain-containing protein, partial [Candidatus Zixiibacteriota bacterium]